MQLNRSMENNFRLEVGYYFTIILQHKWIERSIYKERHKNSNFTNLT